MRSQSAFNPSESKIRLDLRVNSNKYLEFSRKIVINCYKTNKLARISHAGGNAIDRQQGTAQQFTPAVAGTNNPRSGTVSVLT